MRILQSENGFTLIEALIAMTVLTIGILALNSMQINSIQGNSKANRLTTASNWNEDQVERIACMQFTDTALLDTDDDGNGTTMNSSGGDSNGVNFGLDDITAGSADNTSSSLDGRYNIYRNVAVDVPMPGLKTIRIHVQDTQQTLSKPVTLTCIKADTF